MKAATYISMLRGVNVGGKMMKMDALRQLCERLGFENVRTYIQSGNIVYSYRKISVQKLDSLLRQAILDHFNYDVVVISFTVHDLGQIIRANPMARQKRREHTFMHVTFLAEAPAGERLKNIEGGDYKGDEFVWVNKAVYLYCPRGYGNTKLNNTFFEKKLNVNATTRNWKTTRQLFDMASDGQDV